MFKKTVLLSLFTVMLLFTGCENQIATESNGSITIEELYNAVDLSQFSRYGSSTENNVMWVEKSDYTGTQYGCINTKGEYIIPLTSQIKEIRNFDFSKEGFSVVTLEQRGQDYLGIYNTKGVLVKQIELAGALSWHFLNNGNIFFKESNIAYMFCISTSNLVEMPMPAWQSSSTIHYSDGLMLIFSNFYTNPGAKYYDRNGNCCIDLDNSNQNYAEVMYAEDFKNGQASVTFVGLDGKWYKVKINKNGEWINKPEEISKYDAKTFYNSY